VALSHVAMTKAASPSSAKLSPVRVPAGLTRPGGQLGGAHLPLLTNQEGVDVARILG